MNNPAGLGSRPDKYDSLLSGARPAYLESLTNDLKLQKFKYVKINKNGEVFVVKGKKWAFFSFFSSNVFKTDKMMRKVTDAINRAEESKKSPSKGQIMYGNDTGGYDSGKGLGLSSSPSVRQHTGFIVPKQDFEEPSVSPTQAPSQQLQASLLPEPKSAPEPEPESSPSLSAPTTSEPPDGPAISSPLPSRQRRATIDSYESKIKVPSEADKWSKIPSEVLNIVGNLSHDELRGLSKQLGQMKEENVIIKHENGYFGSAPGHRDTEPTVDRRTLRKLLSQMIEEEKGMLTVSFRNRILSEYKSVTAEQQGVYLENLQYKSKATRAAIRLAFIKENMDDLGLQASMVAVDKQKPFDRLSDLDPTQEEQTKELSQIQLKLNPWKMKIADTEDVTNKKWEKTKQAEMKDIVGTSIFEEAQQRLLQDEKYQQRREVLETLDSLDKTANREKVLE